MKVKARSRCVLRLRADAAQRRLSLRTHRRPSATRHRLNWCAAARRAGRRPPHPMPHKAVTDALHSDGFWPRRYHQNGLGPRQPGAEFAQERAGWRVGQRQGRRAVRQKQAWQDHCGGSEHRADAEPLAAPRPGFNASARRSVHWRGRSRATSAGHRRHRRAAPGPPARSTRMPDIPNRHWRC